ncbi:Hypothetical protein GL50581_3129 [Giardia duodenalis ATCC 50581]|nr:Hypothetical protein GL50581_3129 [Giardia intestinalis ATCC 50581]
MRIGEKHGNPDTQKVIQTTVFGLNFLFTLIALAFLFLDPYEPPLPIVYISSLINLLFLFLYTRFTFPYLDALGFSLISALRSSVLTFIIHLPLSIQRFRETSMFYSYLVLVLLVNFHHIYILMLCVDVKVGLQMLGTV